MAAKVLYNRAEMGRRRAPVFALLKLRAPLAQHSVEEGELLRRHAAGARCVVELGVAEGASAWEMRQVVAPDAVLHLVDPYPKGRLFGHSACAAVARRLVASVPRGDVRWQRASSTEAVVGFDEVIDVLFIDADHSYAAVARDWADWSPHVRVGGVAILHDAATQASWIDESDGPVRLVAELEGDPSWQQLESVTSMVALRRVG